MKILAPNSRIQRNLCFLKMNLVSGKLIYYNLIECLSIDFRVVECHVHYPEKLCVVKKYSMSNSLDSHVYRCSLKVNVIDLRNRFIRRLKPFLLNFVVSWKFPVWSDWFNGFHKKIMKGSNQIFYRIQWTVEQKNNSILHF